MKLLYSVALGLSLVWLVLSQTPGQEVAAATSSVNPPPAALAATSGAPRSLALASFTQTVKLIASDRSANGGFGPVTAIDGDTIIVGAKDTAYVFVKPSNGWSGVWTETARLIPSDVVTQGSNYGFSAAISGDTVIVGASSDNGRGAAYIFVKPAGGWKGTLTETAKLTPADGAARDYYFGYSVTISDDLVLVGAPGENSVRGAAYIFDKPSGGWVTNSTFTAKLTASDGITGDGFGDKVALSSDTIVVSAPRDDSKKGSAYVFSKPAAGWETISTFTAKLTTSDGVADDGFGYSLGFDNDTVVAGAIHDDGKGSAYVYVKPISGWETTSTFTAKLIAADGMAGDTFGFSSAVSKNMVVIGAVYDDIGSHADQGSAYLFVKPSGNWVTTATFTAKLTATNGITNDSLGPVAIDGDTVVAGAIGDDNMAGSAYIFTLDPLIPLPKFPAYLPVILR